MFLRTCYVIVLFIISTCISGYAQGEREIYSLAVKAARSDQKDYAFMYFRSLLNNYPESRYTQEALFATGEYYFLRGDNRDAAKAFLKLSNDYPDFKGMPFALIYLWKIAKNTGDEPLIKSLEKKIVSQKRLVLLFKDFKEQTYRSPLLRKHRLVYYIDKLEFYVDGDLLAQIPY